MAKIAIISEFPDAATWSLAECLWEQKQDVLLITSRDAVIDLVPNFPLMTPFRKWNGLEAIKLFPRLLQFNPDVIHFVFSKSHSRVRLAHWLLAPALAAIPNKALALSSFSELNFKNRIDLSFLRFFNLMTFGTRNHLMKVKRSMTEPPLSDVLPPIELQDPANSARLREDLENMVKKLGKFVVLPQAPPSAEVASLLRKVGFETLVISEKFNFNTPYFATGPLTRAEKNYVIKSAQALWLAGLDLSVAELKFFQELSRSLEKPVLISPEQNETLPGLCWHLKSGWILDQGLATLEEILRTNPGLELTGRFQSISSGENLDTSLNELLRLYSRALSVRQT